MISVSFSMVGLFSTSYAFCGFENPNNIDFAQFWHVEVPTPRLIISGRLFPPLIMHLSYFAIAMIGAYSAAMFLAKITVVELKKQSGVLSAKTKSLQKQFAKTLLAQVIFYMILIKS